MTIEEMRRVMRSEVVPEEVIPQNVVTFLMDEDAEPPKLDAFSFLMRLRALGIGSNDFIDLLVGCDAPESVVSKIKQNPAMNLQGLVLTLENSELTTDDYTRMLLTARQVWERTLTLRLEKSEKISREIDDLDETDDKPVKIYGEPDDINADADNEQSEIDGAGDGETPLEPDNFDENHDKDHNEDYDEDYDEDLRELSFTAVLESINAGSKSQEEPREPDGAERSETDADEINSDGETELSFAEAFDKIKSEKKNAVGELTSDRLLTDEQTDSEKTENTDNIEKTDGVVDTTTLVQIDEEMLRESFGRLSGELDSDEPETDVSAVIPEEPERDVSETGGMRIGYHKGAIIGSTVGAAVLVGAGLLIGNAVGGKNANGLHFAEDDYEIFDKIYYAYNDSTPGGELVCSFDNDGHYDHRAVFGDLLLNSEDAASDPNLFSIGTGRYSLTEEAISVVIVENGSAKSAADIVPPENSRFVAAFDSNGELYALFSGKQSGYMKITDGEAQYTVRQDGVLTDYDINGGEIRLGTVYTPNFGHTFTINDEDVYLPKLGKGEPKPISAKNVVVSETTGYSYGVSAGYSTENGNVTEVCAVIGDPVTASADGRFALNGENGLLVKTDGAKLSSRKTEKLAYAILRDNVSAIAEETEPESIKLLDEQLEVVSVLTGITERIVSMRFDGDILTIVGTGRLFSVDCSDLASPAPIKLGQINGIVAGQSAFTCEVVGSKVLITRYDLKNGKPEKVCEYSKDLTAGDRDTVTIGDPKTALLLDGTQSGVAYSYFDGVSVVSEYVVFVDGASPKTVSVYDDKTGFTAAFENGGKVWAVCQEGVKALQ